VNQRICTVLAVLPLFVLSGCGRDSHDSLRQQQVATIKESAETLKPVQDQATADAAKLKLAKLGERWSDLAKRAEVLPKPSSEQEAELKKKFDDERLAAGLQLISQGARVSSVSGGKEAFAQVNDMVNSFAPQAREAIRKRQIETAKEGADLLESIKDKAAADAAKPQVAALVERWNSVEKMHEMLPKSTPEQDAELVKKHGDEWNGIRTRFAFQILRLNAAPWAREVLQPLSQIKKQ